MVPGTMSSLAAASTVSRSATGSNGLRFVAEAAVPPKEDATANTSARIRMVMLSFLVMLTSLRSGRQLLLWHFCDIARARIDFRFRATPTLSRHGQLADSDPTWPSAETLEPLGCHLPVEA